MSSTAESPTVELVHDAGAWTFAHGGQPFFSIGINHVEPHLLLASYNMPETLRRYGTDFVDNHGRFNAGSRAADSWMNTVFAHLRKWGFNTFGYHTSIPLEGLAGTEFFYVASVRSFILERFCPEAERPDVFSEVFRNRVDRCAKAVCELHRKATNLLGYAFSDVPDWNLESKHYPSGFPVLHPWVQEITRAGADRAGKQRWVELLGYRYLDPATVARVYDLPSTTSWEDLHRVEEWGKARDPDSARADSDAFLASIAAEWHRVHSEAVRRYDDRHLVLGDKVKLHSYEKAFVRELAREHYDVLYVQEPPPWEKHAAALENLHGQTGLPILLGDSAVSVRSEWHTQGVKGLSFVSEEDAGKAYVAYLEQVSRKPYILGWHLCGYMEGWPGSWIPERALSHIQCGLIDPFENERVGLTNLVTRANASLTHRFTHA